MTCEDTITSRSGQSYKAAGVDIAAGNRLVDAIKPLAATTNRLGCMAGLGGFGGLFDLKAAGYKDPILVSGTDGVGTKLKVAQATGRHDTIGIDLVAMCVNDLIVQGAEPLFFLDYFATGKLDVEVAEQVVQGIAAGCRLAGCALIGGETAEMPGLYGVGEYDLAGFALGAVEREQLLTGARVAPGDRVIGLASDGLHSNGFSLVRKIVVDLGLNLDDPAPFAPDQSLGTALLTPTRIYVKSCLEALGAGGVTALAHITGGGLIENLPRVLPDNCAARIDAAAWPNSALFAWLAEAGEVAPAEMMRTFNCGIGMIVVAGANAATGLCDRLASAGEQALVLGEIVSRSDGSAQVLLAEDGLPWTG